MAEEKVCGVCGKNAAITSCSECGIPLCSECVREVIIEQKTPGTTHKGITTSTLRPAVKKREVCAKCLKEVDFF